MVKLRVAEIRNSGVKVAYPRHRGRFRVQIPTIRAKRKSLKSMKYEKTDYLCSVIGLSHEEEHWGCGYLVPHIVIKNQVSNDTADQISHPFL